MDQSAAPHTLLKGVVMYQKKWDIEHDGQISQSLSDMQDSNIRLFTESAKHHNQAIEDSKKTAKA